MWPTEHSTPVYIKNLTSGMKRSGGPSWWWKRTNHFISEVVLEGREAQQDREALSSSAEPLHCPGPGHQEGTGALGSVPSQQEQSQGRTGLIPETFLAQGGEEHSSSPVLLHPPSFQNFQLYNDMVPGRAVLTGSEHTLGSTMTMVWEDSWVHDPGPL